MIRSLAKPQQRWIVASAQQAIGYRVLSVPRWTTGESHAVRWRSGGVKITNTSGAKSKLKKGSATPQHQPPRPSAASSSGSGDATTPKNLRLPDQEMEGEIQKIVHHVQTHYKHGQYHEALNSAQELLGVTREHFGKDHPATASAYNNIGLMHKQLGDFDSSRLHYHESLRVYGRVVGKDHASYAAALHNIANLNHTQVHMDDTLSAIQRLQLHEEAMEYLQDAWRIRTVELGEQHPHTVASRSNLGSIMASQVLQQQQQQQKHQQQQQQQQQNDASSSEEPKVVKQKLTRLTRVRWEAAEEHLRQSLEMAVSNPRGDKVADDATSSTALASSGIVTLSASAAAQNLAVFLKSKATMIDDDTNEQEDTLGEAKQLYEQALLVRQELLHPTHPDLVATKYSLAELHSALGDEDGANAIREEIVQSYNVTESEEPMADEEEEKEGMVKT